MKCLEGKQVEKDDSEGRGNTRIFDPADEGESSREALRAAELIGKTYALFDKGKEDGAERELTVKMDYGDNDNSESEPGV